MNQNVDRMIAAGSTGGKFLVISSVAFFKQRPVYGVRCQCSGFRNSVFDEGVNCRTLVPRVKTTHLSAMICYLKPDTRHLKPKIVFYRLLAGHNTKRPALRQVLNAKI